MAWQPTWQLLVAFNNAAQDDPGLITTVASPAGTLGANNVWTDITQYVRDKIDTNRGRQHELDRFQAGTLTATLRNVNGWFDQWNTSGPYTGKLAPGVPVRLQATDPTTHTTTAVYTGVADVWATNWLAEKDGTVQLSCVDQFAYLNQAVVAPQYAAKVVADGATTYFRLNDPPGTTVLFPAVGSVNAYVDTVGNAVTFGLGGAIGLSSATSAQFQSGSTDGGIWNIGGWGGVATSGTLEFWFNIPSSDPGVTPTIEVYNKAIAGMATIVQYANDANGWRCWNASKTTLVQSSAGYNDSTWHHFCWVTTASTDHLYIDGVDVSHSVTATLTQKFFSVFEIGSNDQHVWVNSATAYIQETAWYAGVTLSAGTIAAHAAFGAKRPVESSGTRIGAVLDLIRFASGARNIDTGVSSVQTLAAPIDTTTALSYLQIVEQTENGALFIDATGKVRFINRGAILGVQTSACTFGDGGGAEIPFELAPQLALDTIDVYQKAQLQRTGGVLQNWPAVDTIPAPRVYQQTGLLNTTDYELLSYAQWVVSHFGTASPRARSVTVHPFVTAASGAATTAVLGLDLMSVVTLNRHTLPGAGTAFSQQAFVEGINHHVYPATGDWNVDLQLTPVGVVAQSWTWDTSTWGTGTNPTVWGY